MKFNLKNFVIISGLVMAVAGSNLYAKYDVCTRIHHKLEVIKEKCESGADRRWCHKKHRALIREARANACHKKWEERREHSSWW